MDQDSRLAKLLENCTLDAEDPDSFDAATFLYDLYKTSTVREIDQFKHLLAQVQDEILTREIKTKISSQYQDEHNTFSQEYLIQICQDLLKTHSILTSQSANFSALNSLIQDNVQTNLIDNIQKQ